MKTPIAALPILFLAMSLPLHVSAEQKGLHGNGLAFSASGLWGDMQPVAPDTGLDLNAVIDYFISPYTWLSLDVTHAYVDYQLAPNSSLTVNQSSLGIGVGREIPTTRRTAFFVDGLVSLGLGEREAQIGNWSARTDLEGYQVRAGLGFRGTLGLDEWTIGARLEQAEVEPESGAADVSVNASLSGSALFYLNDSTYLGPLIRIRDDSRNSIGIRLRLAGW